MMTIVTIVVTIELQQTGLPGLSECVHWQVQSVRTPLAICTAASNRLFSPRANSLQTSPILLSKQG